MTNITLFALDKNKTIIDVISNVGTVDNVFYDDLFTQEINVASTFEFSLEYNERTSKFIKAGNYILFKYQNKYYLFIISTAETDDSQGFAEAKVYCESISLVLYNSVMQKTTLNNCNATTFLTTILQDTDFEVGYISPKVDRNAALIEIDKTASVYEILTSQLETFEAEMDIRIEVDGNKVTGMYIDLYSQLGSNNGARFEYSNNLENVTRKEDVTELCTAIIGIGKDELDFREVEWSVDAGNLADKQRGSNFIADNMANSLYGTPGKYIYGIYEDSNCEDPWTLLEKSYEALQERKQPKIDYECKVAYIDGDIGLGDTVNIIDRAYPEPLLLTARVNKLELSFTDESKNTCDFANYKKAYSNIINKNSNLEDLKNYLASLDIGKLTPAEILMLKRYLEQLGIEKDLIDKIFNEITGGEDNPSEDEDYEITTLEGGLWIGDSRMVSMRKHGLFKIESTKNNDYNSALELYKSLGIESGISSSSVYQNLVSSSNKYKIPTIVRYWSSKFGLDPNLIFAIIMAESTGNPTSQGQSSGSGYGLMACERSVFFNNSQTIKFLDGTTKTFTPSYSTMQPSNGGNITLNGVSVDENISNQVMFGCHCLRQAIVDYAKCNIFAGLVSNNMGVGAMYWIVSKYVCDTYGYTFVNKNSIKAQSPEAQKKIYEVLENGGFEFADWRQKWKDNGGAGTVKNVEGYVKWYKIENGQLPYTYDKDGNKFGYGVSGTQVATNDVEKKITTVDSTQLTPTRMKIVEKAKEIVQLHIDKKASYSQVPRTIDDTKRKYIKNGSYVKVNSKGKYETIGSSYFGIPTSANDGKGVIGYDCSSFSSCSYLNAGLKSLYNGNCSGGSIMSEITKNGGMMWLANAEGRKKAKPGDCVMFATGKNPIQEDMDQHKFLPTHHIAVYIGDDQIAHASQWAQHPNAIKISKLSTYKTLSSAFFIRPKDLQDADEKESTIDDTTADVGNNIISKCVIGASAYHFYSNNQLLKNVQVGSYSDTTEYPSSVPYVFVHLGVNDPYESGYSSLKTLLSLLQTKYPNTPIFVARELHVGSKVSNYIDYNKAIDTFNSEISSYCNEHKNLYQINISQNLEESGLLKDSITTDGIHLKTKDDYVVLFNNIKSKIVNKDATEDVEPTPTPTPTPEPEIKKITLESNQNYYYDTVDELYFELPSEVVDSYYTRLKFTASNNFKYSQSEDVFLEGDDCIAGQLVPVPNTTYKIIIMTNVNSSIEFKYYGSVTTVKKGKYTDFDSFVGGEKVAEIAQSYYNKTDLEYRGQYSTTATKTPASYSNPAENLDKWYDSERKKAQIDCSTMTKFTYMGLDYDHSPYGNHKMTSLKRNTAYSWAFTLPRTAADQAKYCVQNGWVLNGADLQNFTNLKAGDMIFWDRDNGDNGRFMNCSHVAICIGKIDGVIKTIESTQTKNGVKIRALSENTPDKILFVARPKKA